MSHGLERAMWEVRQLRRDESVDDLLDRLVADEVVTTEEATVVRDCDHPELLARGVHAVMVMAFWQHLNRRTPLTEYTKRIREAR